MSEEFFKFLGELLENIDIAKFLIYVVSIILIISLPTILTSLKQSIVSERVKSLINEVKTFLNQTKKEMSDIQCEYNTQIESTIDTLSSKVDLLVSKRNNILDNDTSNMFVVPVYKYISLKIYKTIDLLLFEHKDNLYDAEKEIRLLLKREISVLFKKAYQTLSKYRHTNGHKLSFFTNDNWEFWIYNSLCELLFNKEEKESNIRIYIWTLLESSIDEILEEFSFNINNKERK